METHSELLMSLATIKEKLMKTLSKGGEPHAELISKQIIENLSTTEMGLTHLIYAFMGIEEKLKWVVGDECMVPIKGISSWGSDFAAMDREGMIQHGHVKCTIANINLRKKRSVTVKFDGIYTLSTGPEERRSISAAVHASSLVPKSDLKLERPDIADLL